MRRGTTIGNMATKLCTTTIVVAVFGAARVSLAAGGEPRANADSSAVGHWRLLLNDTNRQCRLMLRAEPGRANTQRVGLPAGCRRAIPLLSAVSGWTTGGSTVRFADDDGKPVLEFAVNNDVSNLLAKGPEGETYSLVSIDGAHVAVEERPPTPPPPASWDTFVAQLDPPAKPTVEPEPGARTAGAGAPSDAQIPGRYAVLRKGGKQTGCTLTLDAKAKGPKGGKKANLAPACKDHGIVTFDPRGWRLEDGRLTLTAKKGHETQLDYQKDGTWSKDSKSGTPLSLKRI